MTPEQTLEAGAAQLGLDLGPRGRQRLIDFVAVLDKWNRVYNLTAIRDPMEVVTHHLLDSLAAVPVLDGLQLDSIADVGCGAGLPGIPLAVARPDWQLTLNEKSDKKLAFVRQAVMELGLKNVRLQGGRAERWQPVERFSCVISRAFASLQAFLATCRHLVRPDGVIAAMKGRDPRVEMAVLPPEFDCSDLRRLAVPFLPAERHLVLCRACSGVGR